MGKDLSPQAFELIARRFRVLSESTRLRLINLLQNGEMTASELTEALQTSQPNVSKHLKILTDSGILHREQRGNAVYYAIADETTLDLCGVVCDSLGKRFEKQANLFV